MNEEEEAFLRAHLHLNAANFALRLSSKFGDRISYISQQFKGLQIAKDKFPTWFQCVGIQYPPLVNLEQTSSEFAAKYKSELLFGETLIDLTGGFGIDSALWTKSFNKVIHLEQNETLQQIAQHNFGKLGLNVTSLNVNSIEWLINQKFRVDAIYADPSRRVEGKRVYSLLDCEPNIPELIDLLRAKCRFLLIKASPMYDIQAGLKELENVAEVHVLSYKNECKELLFKLDFETESEVAEIQCVNWDGKSFQKFTFNFSQEQEFEINFVEPCKYLYEPNAALQKAGALKTLAHKFNLEGLHPNTKLLTSNALSLDFPGRIFEIVTSKLPLKANIISRNHPLSADKLSAKYKIKTGGEKYILAFSSLTKKYIVAAERIDI